MVVAQSGGPSPVINNSLRGIIETARELARSARSTARGTASRGCSRRSCSICRPRPAEEVSLLRYTPAAGSIGTCRYKLQAEPDRGFRSRASRCSRPTTSAISSTSAATTRWTRPTRWPSWPSERGLDLVAVGVPKTIDNDVGDSEFKLIDHTPGYGSVGQVLDAHGAERQRGERRLVSGRPGAGDAGDGPQDRLHPGGRAAGRPERARCRCRSIWPRAPARLTQLADKVNDQLRKIGPLHGGVSEGFDVGDIGEVRDSFGHAMFSSSQMTVAQIVVNYLNAVGLAAKGAARGNVPGTDQRHAMALRLDGRSRRGLSQRADGGAAGRRTARAASWPRFSAILARSTASATTKCRWSRWPTASGLSPRNGSRPTATM